jgi:queuine/archaeosine tRNA-ribosyltransferase
VVRLVDDIRASIEAGTFSNFKIDFLSGYYGSPLPP